jgi:hypothetical protein
MTLNEMRVVAAYLTAFAWIVGAHGGWLDGRKQIEPPPERTIYDLKNVVFKGTLP